MPQADARQKAEQVIARCRAGKLRLATAESCTGGMLSAMLTDIPGASEVFWGGMATYANKAKNEILGVTPETLNQFGAVSEQTANKMTLGLWKRYGVDLSAAITGIAGPGGGTKEKPVGTVHIATCLQGNVIHREFHFTGNRQAVREQSVEAALDMLLASMDG